MITSNSNPKVKQIIQWQSKSKERRNAGIFLAEGYKMFEEAPEESIQQIFISADALDKLDAYPEIRDKMKRLGYETVTNDIFLHMSDTQTPQGILCVVKRPQYSLEQLLQTEAPLLIVLEDLQDPGNLGTIIRTGEGAGVTGVIMNSRTVDIFNPKTIRATMGSVFRVPFIYADDLPEVIQFLHSRGVHTYSAHLEGETYYDDFSFREATAFLIGNEGNGLSEETSSLAEQSLRIPMEGNVESLNAAIAASLLMYEAYRQRRKLQ